MGAATRVVLWRPLSQKFARNLVLLQCAKEYLIIFLSIYLCVPLDVQMRHEAVFLLSFHVTFIQACRKQFNASFAKVDRFKTENKEMKAVSPEPRV